MKTAAATSADPRSLCSMKEGLLRDLLGDLKGSRYAFRFAGGGALLPLGGYRMGVISLNGSIDPDDPEYRSIRIEIRDGGETIHVEVLEFSDLYPMKRLSFTGDDLTESDLDPDATRFDIRARVSYSDEGDLKLLLVNIDSKTETFKELPLVHWSEWIGPVMDVLKAWRAA